MAQWKKLPANCSANITTRFQRCVETAKIILTGCLSWADQTQQSCAEYADNGHNACNSWADEGHNACCNWAPCSWFCDAFYWVANLVCNGWYWVADVVCILFVTIVRVVCVVTYLIVLTVCTLWTIITFFLCISWANGGTAFLLTDGNVLMQECLMGYGTRRWWKLTPDINGNYENGRWSRVADSHVARKYFSSSVLADGRVLVFGGEYTDEQLDKAGPTESNTCEIYDPVANSWKLVAAPDLWEEIGDGACTLLADGRFLLGNANDNLTAIFNPKTETWEQFPVPGTTNFTESLNSKNSRSSEESWVLLPDGGVITANCRSHPASEKFDVIRQTWFADRNVPAANDVVEATSIETGCGILLTNGTVLYIGSTGHSAIYTPGTSINSQGNWTAGPELPVSADKKTQGIKDGPGCLMVNGRVLVAIAPVNNVREDYLSPVTFFEFDGSSFVRTIDPPTDNNHPTYTGRMLLLPTGEIMYMTENSSDFYAYTNYGKPEEIAKPTITNCPNIIAANSTIQISGLQFNGLSQAVGYGDDSTASTNYPLVRIKNRNSGHVQYCRTFNHTLLDTKGNTITSMGVATGNAIITTLVEIPASIEAGDADLFVVANGIPSDAFRISITKMRG